jgi:hypothetical protein
VENTFTTEVDTTRAQLRQLSIVLPVYVTAIYRQGRPRDGVHVQVTGDATAHCTLCTLRALHHHCALHCKNFA